MYTVRKGIHLSHRKDVFVLEQPIS